MQRAVPRIVHLLSREKFRSQVVVKFGDTSFQVIGPRRCALRNRAQEAGHSEAVNIDPGPAQGTSGHVAHDRLAQPELCCQTECAHTQVI